MTGKGCGETDCMGWEDRAGPRGQAVCHTTGGWGGGGGGAGL